MPYTPKPFRSNRKEDDAVGKYMQDEFDALGRDLARGVRVLELRPSHKEPKKVVEGMIVFADGSDWDPGGGRGVYVRSGQQWEKL